MLVQDIMQTKVITATPETRLPELLRLLEGRGFRHVPVVEEGRLVGIISDRDLKRAMISAAAGALAVESERLVERLTAGEIMTRTVTTVGRIFAVEDAARLMVTQKISALPVTEGDRLVGIVTETDVLHLFVRAMGALEPSSRLDVVLADGPAALGDVVRTVEAAGTRISSVMTLGSATGFREVVIRVGTINPGPAIKALEAKGYTVRDSWRG